MPPTKQTKSAPVKDAPAQSVCQKFEAMRFKKGADPEKKHELANACSAELRAAQKYDPDSWSAKLDRALSAGRELVSSGKFWGELLDGTAVTKATKKIIEK